MLTLNSYSRLLLSTLTLDLCHPLTLLPSRCRDAYDKRHKRMTEWEIANQSYGRGGLTSFLMGIVNSELKQQPELVQSFAAWVGSDDERWLALERVVRDDVRLADFISRPASVAAAVCTRS